MRFMGRIVFYPERTPVYVKLSPRIGISIARNCARHFRRRQKGSLSTRRTIQREKFFSCAELEFIGQLAIEHDALIYTDEIYEHIVYPPNEHVYPIAMPGLRERTVMVSGLSKTFSVTGWRLGVLHCAAGNHERDSESA